MADPRGKGEKGSEEDCKEGWTMQKRMFQEPN